MLEKELDDVEVPCSAQHNAAQRTKDHTNKKCKTKTKTEDRRKQVKKTNKQTNETKAIKKNYTD
jgi:hypothetical protein